MSFRFFSVLAMVGISCFPLMSCNEPPVGKDGYTYESAEFVHLSPSVTIVLHKNIDDLRRTAPAAARQEGRDLMAYSLIKGNSCEMHIVKPEASYKPEWLGHETYHCIFGRYHK